MLVGLTCHMQLNALGQGSLFPVERIGLPTFGVSRHMTPYSPPGYMQRSIQRSQKARAEFACKNGVMCKHPGLGG